MDIAYALMGSYGWVDSGSRAEELGPQVDAGGHLGEAVRRNAMTLRRR